MEKMKKRLVMVERTSYDCGWMSDGLRGVGLLSLDFGV